MKWVKAFFDSLHLSWIGRFGGSIKERNMHILWPIKVYPNARVELTKVNIVALRELEYIFIVMPIRKTGDIENERGWTIHTED